MLARGWAGALPRALATGVAYAAAALLGVWLGRAGGSVAAFWPANGLLLGLLLRSPGPGLGLPVAACVAAKLAVNLALGDGLALSLGFVAANLLEVGVAFVLLRRLAGLPVRLASLRELAAFLLAAGLLAPAASATLGAALVHGASAAPFWAVWRTWWTGDAVGMVLVTPLVAGCDGGEVRRLLAGRHRLLGLAEAAAVPLLLSAGIWLVIVRGNYGLPGLFAPVLLWAALRFGVAATAALSLGLALVATAATAYGIWPLPFAAGPTLADRIAPLQLFLVLAALPPLVVAVVTAGRERLARELRQGEERYRALVESSPDAVLAHRDGRVTYANARAARLLGAADASALLGRPVLDLVRPDDRPAVAERGRRALAGETNAPWRHALRRLDGGEVPVETTSVGVRLGGDAAVLVVARDLSERRRLADELAEARRHLDEALDGMADAFALYEADRLVLCNPAYRAMFLDGAGLPAPGAHIREVLLAIARGRALPDAGAPEAWAERHLALFRGRAEDEYELADGRWVHVLRRPTAGGGTVVACRDVTERKRLERAIEHQATHDALTGLANRAAFLAELGRARARAERDGGRLAVMLVDLDRFKEVNDTHGHGVGDALLAEVARRLEGAVREGDLVARLGGDEFAVLAPGRPGPGGFATLAGRVVARLAEPLRLGGAELRPGGTVGLTVFPDDPGTAEELLVSADRALYAAKEAGRGGWAAYATGMRDGQGAALGADIAGALERGELDLDVQPILALDTLEPVGAEALVRWNHPTRGRLPAAGFIDAVERGPAILPLTRFVLGRALAARQAWCRAGAGDLRIWVNLAPRCLAWDGLVDAVAAALAEAGTAPDRLVLEVTEGAIAAAGIAEARLAALRLLGVGVAVDDFGAGHSSLGRLKALPLDLLKIDRAFVTGIAADERDRAIVRTVVALGDNLGLTPTAEGIETREQLAALRRLGCRLAQGYLFARPMPAADLPAWLAAWRRRREVAPDADLLRREGEAV